MEVRLSIIVSFSGSLIGFRIWEFVIFNDQKQLPEVFYKKGALKIFAKFSGNFQADSCNFIKEKTLVQAFSCEFCEISKNSNFIENLRTTASEVIVTGAYKKWF